MNNPYFNAEAIPGPVSTQPQYFWRLPATVMLRWRFWPPSPQPTQMSNGQQTAPIAGRVGTGPYATQEVQQPAAVAPAATEGLRAPAQSDMLIGGAYPLPNY